MQRGQLPQSLRHVIGQGAGQALDIRSGLALQRIKHLAFDFRVEIRIGEQRVVNADMTDIQGQGTTDAGACERREHQ